MSGKIVQLRRAKKYRNATSYAMTYKLIILIFVAAHAEQAGATVPLTLGSYKAAATCNEVARDVIKQQLLDHGHNRCRRIYTCPCHD